MPHWSENKGHDVLRGDVILPRTSSNESPAVLENSVLWYGSGEAVESPQDMVVDSECRDTVRGSLEGEHVHGMVDPRLVSELSCEPVCSVAGKLASGHIRFPDQRAENHSFMFGEGASNSNL